MVALPLDEARQAAGFIASQTSLLPAVGMVLGSGWGAVAEAIRPAFSLPYQEIPHFPRPGVEGHAGRLVLGRMSGKAVAAMSGRFHLYEGYPTSQVALPVLVLRELGVGHLLLTNASGGLNPDFRPGEVMAITDHINLPGLCGLNPLVGMEGAFLDMGEAYSRALRQVAVEAAARLGLPLHQGVYAMVAGPIYETPAEARLLRSLGADAVGMSTLPEVLAARWAGMQVLGLSLITNYAAEAGEPLSHTQVLRRAEAAAPKLKALVEAIMAAIET